LHRFARAVLRGERIQLYGDGTQSRDFTYVDDIVAANIAAARSDAAGEVFNIGGGSRTTINETIAILGELAGRAPLVNYEDRQKGDVGHTAADTSAARGTLGFTPKVPLKEGLRREVDWLREAAAA
jgi:UDP-glucose 4-epimerase